MKKLALFGGSGGLGTKLAPLLENKYDVIKLSSKDLDVRDIESLNNFFEKKNLKDLIKKKQLKFGDQFE